MPFPDHGLEMFVVIEEIWQEQGPEPAFPIFHAVLELQKTLLFVVQQLLLKLCLELHRSNPSASLL